MDRGICCESNCWDKITQYADDFNSYDLKSAFISDENRAHKFSVQHSGVLFDYSKNLISSKVLDLLVDLANERKLSEWIDNMFAGKEINHTENRAVLHTVLRSDAEKLNVDGKDVIPEIKAVYEKMTDFVNCVHGGKWLGFSGKKITNIVNIGIGGSHLGPEMIVRALAPYRIAGISSHFIANIDSDFTDDLLSKLNPETTLFVISSKSFVTQETLENALVVKNWFLTKVGKDSAIASHFIAVSNNIAAAKDFGIDEDNIFAMWDWVGGRYSVWSSVGISVALTIGIDNYFKVLDGAREADKHFKETPFSENIPVIMALIGIWYRNFLNIQSYAVVPYSENLNLLVNYLQQAAMESNGKCIDRDGQTIVGKTGPVIWGGTGACSQHAFFQHLHQGSDFTPVDFIVAAKSHSQDSDQQPLLLANCFAQSMALMQGKNSIEARQEMMSAGMGDKDIEKLLPYKVFDGNKPSNMIVLDELSPKNLGFLIATYEHKIFVQGVIWNINSFDQWGVELGKQLANQILPAIKFGKDSGNADFGGMDSSTSALISYVRNIRGE